ncbi:hypothetical protein F5Y17DRAFT_105498 [Xylariaceae sp. FL0594]|nr:hypothetical protein F5Y17DRAFT_105498 [Xylariaceae sp. FL0594]
MPLPTTALTVAAASSIFASAWFTGVATSFSVAAIPTILSASGAPGETILQQWRFFFIRGAWIMPAIGTFSMLSHWAVAYYCWMSGVEWRGFAAAGVSSFFVHPYTLFALMPTNYRLLAASDPAVSDELKSEKKATLTEDAARTLIRKWGALNVPRAVVPAIGTVLALWNFAL